MNSNLLDSNLYKIHNNMFYNTIILETHLRPQRITFFTNKSIIKTLCISKTLKNIVHTLVTCNLVLTAGLKM